VRRWVVTLVLGLVAGCGSDGDQLDPGTETGPCIQSQCMPGLVCASDVCVMYSVTPTGGDDDVGDDAADDAGEVTGADAGGDGTDTTDGGLQCEVPPCTSFTRDIQPILISICAQCHTAQGQWSVLRLDSNPVANYDRIVGQPGPTQPTPGSSVNLIEPYNPAFSYLLAKLEGRHTDLGAVEGLMQMPLSGNGTDADPWVTVPLPDAQLELIEAWILEGAPE
jgi:hypothetical protein